MTSLLSPTQETPALIFVVARASMTRFVTALFTLLSLIIAVECENWAPEARRPSVIAMIPARLGSHRLRLKNLRVLDGRAVIEHSIEAAVRSGVFDRIVLNSDNEVFRSFADRSGIDFFLREPALGGNETSADDVVADFIAHFPGFDFLVWVNPTSPLQSAEEIRTIVEAYVGQDDSDTIITTTRFYRHAVLNSQPVNFDASLKAARTQDLPPVSIAVYSILAWRYSTFLESYHSSGAGYFSGRIGFPSASRAASLILKEEEDLWEIAGFIASSAERSGRSHSPSLLSLLTRPEIPDDRGRCASRLFVTEALRFVTKEVLATLPSVRCERGEEL